MSDDARDKVKQLRKKLKSAKRELEHIESNCTHDWNTEADHIHHPGGMTPGDPPGTMGVDWRGPVYISPSTTKRWKRTCSKCGKVEHTTRIKKDVKKTVTENPVW